MSSKFDNSKRNIPLFMLIQVRPNNDRPKSETFNLPLPRNDSADTLIDRQPVSLISSNCFMRLKIRITSVSPIPVLLTSNTCRVVKMDPLGTSHGLGRSNEDRLRCRRFGNSKMGSSISWRERKRKRLMTYLQER